jgi:hypothetical protein
MSKLIVSISFILYGVISFAQKADSTGFFVIPGFTITPFSLGKGYSASAYYSLQFGSYSFPVKGVIRVGVPNYSIEISSSEKIDYNIQGAYIEPGAIFYFGDIRSTESVFFIGLMGYIGTYNHHIKMEISDPYWGTSQLFQYDVKTRAKGVILEAGWMFSFDKKLKGTVSVNTGGVWLPHNPIPQIHNFKNQSKLVPGAGYGNGVLFGLNLGLHYIID